MSKIIRITYSFQEGSVPPPHYYEYEICLEKQKGLISYIPDYSADDVPVWQKLFSVKPGVWLQICEVFDALLETPWKQDVSPCIGGALEWVIVETIDGQEKIPTHLIQYQKELAAEGYQQLRLIVPQIIWEDLDLRRARYWKENLKD